MSNEKLSPEIMEEIEKNIDWKLDDTISAHMQRMAAFGMIGTPSEWNEFCNHLDIFSKMCAERGATIALTKQWVKVTDNTVFPDSKFIGCEEGSKWVGEVYCHPITKRIYRLTDFYEANSIFLSHWMSLPAAPNNNQK